MSAQRGICSGFAAGRATEMAEEIWATAEAELLVIAQRDGSPGLDRLNEGEISLLRMTFRAARDACMLYLSLKLDHWKTLPWLFCVLAHWSEDIARQVGSKCQDIFENDPRPESHDEITWKLMCPGSRFASDLILFVGARRARASLSKDFRYEIAVRRIRLL